MGAVRLQVKMDGVRKNVDQEAPQYGVRRGREPVMPGAPDPL